MIEDLKEKETKVPKFIERTIKNKRFNKANFFYLMDKIDWSYSEDNKRIEPLVEYLSKLDDIVIFYFEDKMAELLYALDTKEISNGLAEKSVDGFLYARCVALINGAGYYYVTLNGKQKLNPDLWYENILYVSRMAWARKHNKDTKDYPHITKVSWETYSNKNGWSEKKTKKEEPTPKKKRSKTTKRIEGKEKELELLLDTLSHKQCLCLGLFGISRTIYSLKKLVSNKSLKNIENLDELIWFVFDKDIAVKKEGFETSFNILSQCVENFQVIKDKTQNTEKEIKEFSLLDNTLKEYFYFTQKSSWRKKDIAYYLFSPSRYTIFDYLADKFELYNEEESKRNYLSRLRNNVDESNLITRELNLVDDDISFVLDETNLEDSDLIKTRLLKYIKHDLLG